MNVDPHQAREIAESQAFRARVREGYLPLEEPVDGLARMGDRGDGACDFLDAQSLCSLHAELGIGGKPLGCQLFPYQMAYTPDGTFVHLSFGCPPVVAGLDQDAETNRRELAQALTARLAARGEVSADYQARLSQGQSISWSSYLQLEQHILNAYSPSDPLVSIMRIVLSISRASVSGSGQTGRPWPVLAALREDTGFAAELLVKYLGLLVGMLEEVVDEPARNRFIKSVQDGLSVYSERYHMGLPPLCLAPPSAGWILKTFDRYFRNAVLGKSLLRTTVLARLLTTACAMVLVSHYAEAYRMSRGESLVNLRSLTDAFEIVESRIATHSQRTDSFFADLERMFARLSVLPIEML